MLDGVFRITWYHGGVHSCTKFSIYDQYLRGYWHGQYSSVYTNFCTDYDQSAAVVGTVLQYPRGVSDTLL
jgi:hypothetical protein